MKTKNNVQKTILRSVAVVISFVLISLTVSGQDFWKKLLANSSFNEIALAMVENTKEPTATKSVTETLSFKLEEKATDAVLKVEDWMHSDESFGIADFEIAEECEIELKLEKWMLDENLFQVKENGENPLDLETWMTTEEVWEI